VYVILIDVEDWAEALTLVGGFIGVVQEPLVLHAEAL
jgi:hypothetical protein